MRRPATPPILHALPPSAAMYKKWASVYFCVLVLHLFHHRHEAVGVELGTVELAVAVGLVVPVSFFLYFETQFQIIIRSGLTRG